MIKIVFCMRRAAHLSQEQFSDYWLNSHVNLVRKHAALLGVRGYVQSHIIGREFAEALRSDWTREEPFDGMAEIYLDDLATMQSSHTSPAAAAAQAELKADEQTFVDRSRSHLFITEIHDIIPLTA